MNNQLLNLLTKRAQAWDMAKAFHASKSGIEGCMSNENAAIYDRMEADVFELTREIERMNAAESRPEAAEPRSLMTDRMEKWQHLASSTYNRAFWTTITKREPERTVQDALTVGDDGHGGYLVPSEFERQIVEALQEQCIIRQYATTIRSDSGERRIPIVTGKGAAYWTPEEGAIVPADDTFDQIYLSSHKLGTLIKVSEELLNDAAFNIPAYIAGVFAQRIGVAEEEAFLTGDGVHRPLGLLSDIGGGETGVITQDATKITMDEVIDLYHSLRAPYRRNAVFVMHDQTAKALRKIKNANDEYLWQDKLSGGLKDTILGRPVLTSAFMPRMEAGEKAILFADLSRYWIADRQNRSFKRLNELYAATGQVGFLASERVDARLILPEAAKVLKMHA